MELLESMRLKDSPIFQLLEKLIFVILACVLWVRAGTLSVDRDRKKIKSRRITSAL